MSENSENNVYVTSTSVSVNIMGVSQLLLDKLRSSVKIPKKPQYEDAVGQMHDHTKDTLKVMGDVKATKANEKAWKIYLEELDDSDEVLKTRMARAILMKGLLFDMPEDSDWIEMQKFLSDGDLEIPEDELGLRYHYIQTEVLGSADDMVEVFEKIMRNSNIPEDKLVESRKSFRVAVEEAEQVTTRSGTKRGRRKVVKQ